MKLSLVVAMDRNGLIGKDGGLPWPRIPEDMWLFRTVTEMAPVIMGRKTFMSIGGRLAGRANIVMTRYKAFRAPGAHIATNTDQALEWARWHTVDGTPWDTAYVIGGPAIYGLFAGDYDTAHVTLIDGAYEGDTYFPFPLLDSPEWEPAADPVPLCPGVTYHKLRRKAVS